MIIAIPVGGSVALIESTVKLDLLVGVPPLEEPIVIRAARTPESQRLSLGNAALSDISRVVSPVSVNVVPLTVSFSFMAFPSITTDMSVGAPLSAAVVFSTRTELAYSWKTID